MYPFGRLAALIALAYTVLSVPAGIFMMESSLHPQRLPNHNPQQFADLLRRDFQAHVETISLRARDGVLLEAWYVKPRHDNGNTIVVLHGQGSNREEAAGYGRIFLKHGFRVLLPDSRAHGDSGGRIATYGLKEAGDVSEWVSWLEHEDASHCVFAYGASMGAATLLQSLAVERRFCAIVADSSFATFREIAYDRAGSLVHAGHGVGSTLGLLPVQVALEYARLRYGVDMERANPVDAIRNTNVPVMLIHGLLDNNIPPSHSEQLKIADPRAELWLVPGASHTGACITAPGEFEKRVVGFFDLHRRAKQAHHDSRIAG